MQEDPQETTNLWNERADVVQDMSALLARYQEDGHSARRS